MSYESAVVVPYEQLSAKRQRVVDEHKRPDGTADQINAACYMPPADFIAIDGVICEPYDTCMTLARACLSSHKCILRTENWFT